jgi:hypothetical protein
MRSSSNWHSVVAIPLCAVLMVQWAAPSVSMAAEPSPEPALLLKFAAPDVPEDASREILEPLAGILAGEIRVRWVAPPVEKSPEAPDETGFPVADDAALRSISAKIALASADMERVEGESALRLLSEAEQEARGYRLTETVRPFLAEIFLREGILKLWKGDTAGAETLLSRSRALRPGFSPDPALFPPQFLAVWDTVRRRPLPEAELLVQSLPSGAAVFVDGEYRGTTPCRIRPGTAGPVRIRVSHPGYKDAERTGQWLPGDTETIGFSLPGDRVARLGELLGAPEGKTGSGAGPLIAEFAQAAGVSRVAVLTLEKSGDREGYRARAYSGSASGGDPVFLGETDLPGGERGAELYGSWAAGKLLQNGWPPERKDREGKPWYKTWWVWGILIAGAGVAVALGSGGGSSSGGGGSVAVNF